MNISDVLSQQRHSIVKYRSFSATQSAGNAISLLPKLNNCLMSLQICIDIKNFVLISTYLNAHTCQTFLHACTYTLIH